jgi:hypothetical protein
MAQWLSTDRELGFSATRFGHGKLEFSPNIQVANLRTMLVMYDTVTICWILLHKENTLSVTSNIVTMTWILRSSVVWCGKCQHNLWDSPDTSPTMGIGDR